MDQEREQLIREGMPLMNELRRALLEIVAKAPSMIEKLTDGFEDATLVWFAEPARSYSAKLYYASGLIDKCLSMGLIVSGERDAPEYVAKGVMP